MEKRRSVGVTILGIFLILFSLLSFGAMFLSPVIFKNLRLLVLSTFYLVMFITAIGILRLESWARITALVLFAIKTIQTGACSIIDFNTMIRKSAGSGAIFLVIGLYIAFIILGIGIIYYLTPPK